MTIRNTNRLASLKALLAAIAFAAVFHADAQVSGGGVSYVAPKAANPTATIGLTAVNGSATTFMRSDAAPAFGVGISPTWSGLHTFSNIVVFSSGANFGTTATTLNGASGTLLIGRGSTSAPTSTTDGFLLWQQGTDPLNAQGTAGSVAIIARNLASAGLNLVTQNLIREQISYAGNVVVNAPTSGVALSVNAVSGTHSTQIADSANTKFNAGFLEVPINNQATPYTAVLADSGKTLYYTAAGAPTFTIPANSSVAYPVGTQLTFVNDASAAVSMTIAITTDTLVLSPGGTTGSRTLAQFGKAVALKVTTTRWIISGSGLT